MTSGKKRKKKEGIQPAKKNVALKAAALVVDKRQAAAAGLTGFSHPAWNWFLLSALALGAAFSQLKHFNDMAVVFAVCAALLGFSFLFPVKNLNHVFLIIGAGWLLSVSALGSVTNFSYAFIPLGGLSLPNPLFHFSIGLGLMLAFWRFLPSLNLSADISAKYGRIWFWLIFLVAVFLRFQKINEVPGAYWDDPAVCIVDPQGILNFHEHPMLFPLGQREPFFSYFLAGLWSLHPSAHAIFVQRLGGAILDLAAVLVFYWAGKEAGGVRVGLIAEALAAFSKPMLIENLIGMTAVTVPLAVGLLLLTTIRLFKKADWPRFIQWGLALGFAPYNYTPVRTWLPFIVVAVFLWIWFFKLKSRPKTKEEFILGWGIILCWNYLFLKTNNFLPQGLVPSHSWHVWLFALVVLGVLVYCGLRIFSMKPKPLGSDQLPFFLGGVLLAAAIIYPLASDPEIAVHTSGLSVFHNQETRTFDYQNTVPVLLVKKTINSLETMFLGGQDRGDLNLPWDAFFEFHFIPLFLFGFVAFLSRPNWLTGFLILGGFVGISTHVLSIDPHSAKMVAAIAPLAILSGLGLQEFCSAFKTANQGKYDWALAVLFAAYLGWGAWGTYDRVWKHYFNTNGIDKIVSQEVAQLSGQYRIYFDVYQDFASPQSQTLLDEGTDVYIYKKQNPIFLRAGEKTPDVAVLLQISDRAKQEEIQKEFKDVSWTVIHNNREGAPEVLRVAKIPAADIPAAPGKSFEIKTISDTSWIRDYFVGPYILGAGFIETEEAVATPYDRIPDDMGGRMLRISGQLNLTEKQDFHLKVSTANYAILKVDGKTVIDLKPWNAAEAESKSMTLDSGAHEIYYLVYLHNGNEIPAINRTEAGQTQLLFGMADTSSPKASPAVTPIFDFGSKSR